MPSTSCCRHWFVAHLGCVGAHSGSITSVTGTVRDYLHVADVVEAYLLLLERGTTGEAYNVCSGEG